MKENNIDKLFKAKASKGDFTFKEAHWAAAEKMLDAQPKSGGFRFGLMSLLTITAITLLGVILVVNKEPAEIENNTTESITRIDELNPAEQTTPSNLNNPELPTNNQELSEESSNSFTHENDLSKNQLKTEIDI